MNNLNNKIKGIDCCSDTSISFHSMHEKETKRLNSILEKTKSINVTFEYIIDKILNSN
jgi:hypothetical protein